MAESRNSLVTSANQLGQTIVKLRGYGVRAERIAPLLNLSRTNIYQIDSRGIGGENPVVPEIPELTNLLEAYDEEKYWQELRKSSLPPSRRMHEGIAEREALIDTIVAQHRRSQKFEPGALALRKLLPTVANAAQPEQLRLRAKLNRMIAWFYTHQGKTRSTLRFGITAMTSALDAFDVSLGDRRHLVEYCEAALIVSNALLLSHRPTLAWHLLDLADAAMEARGEGLGSEHWRQRGTAALELGGDRLAEYFFNQAKQAMVEKNEAQHAIDLESSSDRQRNFLQPGKYLSSALEYAEKARNYFGRGSLQHVMGVHWAAATAFRTDSHLRSFATNHVDQIAGAAQRFPHQATVNFLLSITPELGLSPEQENDWLRFLLYENVARNQ